MAVDGYLNFDTKIDLEGFNEDIDKVEEKTKNIPPVNVEVKVHSDGVDQAVNEVSHAEEKINEILNNTERSAKSKAMAIAAVYKNQGYTQQESLKKAWEQIERSSSDAQDKIQKKSGSAASTVKKNWLSALSGIKQKFNFSGKELKNSLKKLKSQLSGFLNIDAKINEKGFTKGVGNIVNGLKKLKSQLMGVAAAVGAAFSVKAITAFVKSAKEAWNVQLEAETKLETVLGRNLGATKEQINSAKEWASALQEVGVIGDEIQLSGLQELSTYIENADSLKEMNVVLNDMLAQQYGLNATAENAVTISTMLGKVLEGQTSALSRYGYSFTDAQEKLLKYGSEEQRVATLAEVVEASVGGMNEALAKTPAGRLKQVSNTMGDVKEQFGQAFTNIQALFIPALKTLADMLANIAQLSVKVSQSIANIFGVEISNAASIASGIGDSVEAQNDLTDAVEETAKAQENLAGFDKLNIISSGDSSDTESADSSRSMTVTPAISEGDIKNTVDSLTEKLRKYIEPIKLAWKDNSPTLIKNAQYAADKIKGLFSAVATSLDEVWKNGSGERLVGNIIILFGDVLGIIGDISAALKNAWEDEGRGTALVQSYSDRWNALLELIHAVADDFRAVWNDGAGEEILGDVLEILTNINQITANLRTSFKKAWQENKVGKRLIENVLGIFSSILGTVKRCVSAASEWAKKVDFSPLLESLEKITQALKPITDNIGKGLEWLFKEVLLPLAGWVIEDYLPVFLRGVAAGLKIFNSVIEVFKPLFKWLWDKALKPLAKFTGGAFIEWMETAVSALEEFADLVDLGVPEVEEFFSGIAQKAQDAWEFIKSSWVGAIAYFSDIWDGIKQVISDAVAEVISNLYNFYSGGIGIFNDFWNGIKEIFSQVGSWFKERFQEAWDNVVSVWSVTVDWFGKVWDGIKEIFSKVGKWFKERFSTAWNNIVAVWKVVTSWFGEVWNGIKSIFSVVGTWFKERFQAAWDNIVAVWKGVTSWFSDIWDGIVEVFSPVDSWFKERFENAWGNIKNAFSDVKSWFGNRWNDIKGIFSGVGEWFQEKFQCAYDNVTRIWDSITGFFSGIWEGVSNGARDGVNWIIGRLNDLLWSIETGLNWVVDALNNALTIDIPDNVPGIGGTHFGLDLSYIDVPEIPYLAQGTVVPANYGNFLAMLGDNKRETEVVSPLSTIKKAVADALNGYGGNPKEIVINTYLYPNSRYFHREVVKIVNEDARNRGVQ